MVFDPNRWSLIISQLGMSEKLSLSEGNLVEMQHRLEELDGEYRHLSMAVDAMSRQLGAPQPLGLEPSSAHLKHNMEQVPELKVRDFRCNVN